MFPAWRGVGQRPTGCLDGPPNLPKWGSQKTSYKRDEFWGRKSMGFPGVKKRKRLTGPNTSTCVYIYIYMATGSILEPKLLSIWGSWKLILLVLAKHLTNCGSWGTRHDFQHTICSGALGSSMPVPCQSFSTFSLHHLSFPVQCHLPMNQESYTCSIMIKGETSN